MGVVQPIRRCLFVRILSHFTVPVLQTGQGNSPCMSSFGKSRIMVRMAVDISSNLPKLLSRVIFLGYGLNNLKEAVLKLFVFTKESVHFLLHRRSSYHRD